MPSNTPNYNLWLYNLTTDASQTASSYRDNISGTGVNSNMNKIDAALKVQADLIAGLSTLKAAIPVAMTYSSPDYTATGITLITAYSTGMSIVVTPSATNVGSARLNINSLGLKDLAKVNSSGTVISLNDGDMTVGRKYSFIYDGTRWVWINSNAGDQINIQGTSGNVVTVSATKGLDGTTTQSSMISATTFAATGKTTPVDADTLPITDSAASNALKKVTWANIKATLKTYFDGLYLAVTNKASVTDVNTGTDDTKYITALGLRGSSIWYLPDGLATNYQITSSIAGNNLTIALKGADGNDPSASNPVIFRAGNTFLTLTSALSVTILASYGDMFAWDAAKIQGNDTQLFIYLINNNGTIQLGASFNPSLTTVATNYLDTGIGTQVGSKVFTNIIMSGTRNATNSCRVIGRLNVNQADTNNWQAPVIAGVVSVPTYNTDWLSWTPQHSRSGGAYGSLPTVSLAKYKIDGKTVYWIETHTQAAVPGSSGFQRFTAPVVSLNGNTGTGLNASTLDVMLPFTSTGSNQIQLYHYDGAADCGATNIYSLSGFYTVQ